LWVRFSLKHVRVCEAGVNETLGRLFLYAFGICGTAAIVACSTVTATHAPQSVRAPSNRLAAPLVGGVYTEQQANRGKVTYTKYCESCHQVDLLGLDCNPALAGPSFYKRWSGLTLADIFFKASDSMPVGAAGSLSQQEYADVISYVLKVNGLPAGETELPADLEKLRPIAIRENKAQ